MAEESAKLRIPYIAAAQAQKHVTHNEGVTLLDTVVQLSVLDKDLAEPPAEPVEGDTYIVAGTSGGGTGTGAWAGWDARVARFIDGAWRSYLPGQGNGAGWLAWVMDEDAMYRFDGADWALAGIEGPEGPEGPAGADGADGADGQSFQPDAVVNLIAGREAYDDEAAAFSVLVVSDASNGNQPTLYFKLSAGSADWSDGIIWAAFGGGSGGGADTVNGRLTLESGVPISPSDQTAKTTLYFTPHGGNQIALYDGSSAWGLLTFAEVSISLAGLTADTNYDVFGYDSSGLTLELVAWTNATTRATAIALQDGIYVKSGETTKRYLGTIRTAGTIGQCEDSKLKRFVWNMYNRRPRALLRQEDTDNWTYSTATLRQANGSAANQVAMVRGLDEDMVQLELFASVNNSASTLRNVWVAIGLDSTSAAAADAVTNRQAVTSAKQGQHAAYYSYPGLGYHFLSWLEKGAGNDTQTWTGDETAPDQSGLVGTGWA